MLKSILISAVMLLLLAGLTYSQDITDDEIFEFGTDENTYNPPYNPDWMSNDVLVDNHSGNTTNLTHKTLDMEYCEENGNLYLAACINNTDLHGIKIWCSSNSGLTWALKAWYGGMGLWWTGLSMKVEQRYGHPDSVRVNIFYTRSSSANNDNASLHFMSCTPHVISPSIGIIIATPAPGRKFAFPSAYSNGQFQSSGTDIGCIVGEYNNAGNFCYSLKKYCMFNWSWNFTGYTFIVPIDMFYPSAVYKNNASGTDSVYIAVESRITGRSQIDLLRTRAWGGGSWPITTIRSFAGTYLRNPCLSIPQNKYTNRMVITYTQNATSTAASGRGRFSCSTTGGAGWNHGSLGLSYTTRYTWVSADTNGNSGYCTFIWGDSDSLNVRRGSIFGGVGGTFYYDRASHNLTGTAFPVCAVYNNSSGNHRRSVFAYWKSGPQDIYANAENLPTGITNTNGIVNIYSLSQNYPNPFNPTTSINFSIPQDGLVKLVVFDILGKEVAILVNDEQTAGTYQVTFDASKLTSGVYFYKITSGDFSEVKKMLLIK